VPSKYHFCSRADRPAEERIESTRALEHAFGRPGSIRDAEPLPLRSVTDLRTWIPGHHQDIVHGPSNILKRVRLLKHRSSTVAIGHFRLLAVSRREEKRDLQFIKEIGDGEARWLLTRSDHSN
jgi:hypothetical protein